FIAHAHVQGQLFGDLEIVLNEIGSVPGAHAQIDQRTSRRTGYAAQQEVGRGITGCRSVECERSRIEKGRNKGEPAPVDIEAELEIVPAFDPGEPVGYLPVGAALPPVAKPRAADAEPARHADVRRLRRTFQIDIDPQLPRRQRLVAAAVLLLAAASAAKLV